MKEIEENVSTFDKAFDEAFDETLDGTSEEEFEESEALETVDAEKGVSVNMIPVGKLFPNEWNPNVMTDRLFNELVKDVDEDGFLQPILVVPFNMGGAEVFKIIDGEHRFEVMKLLDKNMIPCIVNRGELSKDVTRQKIKTVRMNKIRGNLDQKKFRNLLRDVATELPLDQLATEFIYDDPDELKVLIEDERSKLPSEEMKKQFDKAKKEIKTIDDLSSVLNNLFANYGSTLAHHYMVIEYGGKEHLWVRVSNRKRYDAIKRHAAACIDYGITFDSLIQELLDRHLNDKFVEVNRNLLDAPDSTEPQ